MTFEGCYNRKTMRKKFLELFNSNLYTKTCIWLNTNFEICQEREINIKHRTDQIVYSQATGFQPPTLDEGWDEIIIIKDNDYEHPQYIRKENF